MKAVPVLPLLCLCRLVAARPITAWPEAGVGAARFLPESRQVPVAPLILNGAQSQNHIDNRPQLPSSSDIPSVVLASQKPLETTYLLSLSRKGRTEKTDTGPGRADEEVGQVPETTVSLKQPGWLSKPATTTHGCLGFGRAYRSNNLDVSVICLVALFVLVVAKIESSSAGSSWSSEITTSERSGGPLRLDIDPPAARQLLPIQASAETPAEQLITEKRSPGMLL